MISSNSSTWRCSNQSDERRGRVDGRKERSKQRKGKKKWLEKKKKRDQWLSLHIGRVPRKKNCTLCFFSESPLKLGIGNLAVFFLFSSLTFPQSPCSWHGLLGLPVCSWLLCLPLTNLGHHPSVFPQPSSSNNFPWATLQEASSSNTSSSVGSTHLPFLPCPPLSPAINYSSRWECLCNVGGKLGVVALTPALQKDR